MPLWRMRTCPCIHCSTNTWLNTVTHIAPPVCALLSLSLDHRTAVVSAYYLGQSAAEIAAKENIPEGTVRSRIHYALRALRLALQERGVTQ